MNYAKYELEGYIAFTGGKLRLDCPYLRDSLERKHWERGWNKGYAEERIEQDIERSIDTNYNE